MNGLKQKLLLPVVLLVALLTVFCTMTVLIKAHWYGPFRDMWEIYPFLVRIVDGTWTWSELWQLYGGSHRLFIPKLLFIADYYFVDANNHLLITVSVLCQVIICFLFARLIFASDGLQRTTQWILLLCVVSLQFSATLLFNFMHTFDVQWFTCCVSVALAFYLLAINEKPGPEHFFISGLCIVVASLSNFSGVVAWAIWAVLLWFALPDIKQRIGLSVLALIFLAAYAEGMMSAGMAVEGVGQWLRYLFYLVVYFPGYYLSNPLSSPDFYGQGVIGCLMVGLVLLLLIHFWWQHLLQKNPASGLLKFAAMLVLFAYGVAFATGLGRGYDPSHVHAMRYQNIVVLFWSGALMLLLLNNFIRLRLLRGATVLIAVTALAGFWGAQPGSLDENLRLGRNVQLAHVALVMGFTHVIEAINATVSRSQIYVPDYNLERERELHKRAIAGAFARPYGQYFTGALEENAGEVEKCPQARVKLNDDDTRYLVLHIRLKQEEQAGIDNWLLVDAEGVVQGVAITQLPVDFSRLFRHNQHARFRGFAYPGTKEAWQQQQLYLTGLKGKTVVCRDN